MGDGEMDMCKSLVVDSSTPCTRVTSHASRVTTFLQSSSQRGTAVVLYVVVLVVRGEVVVGRSWKMRLS